VNCALTTKEEGDAQGGNGVPPGKQTEPYRLPQREPPRSSCLRHRDLPPSASLNPAHTHAESPSSLLRVPPKRSCLLDSHGHTATRPHDHTATRPQTSSVEARSSRLSCFAGSPQRAAVATRAGSLEKGGMSRRHPQERSRNLCAGVSGVQVWRKARVSVTQAGGSWGLSARVWYGLVCLPGGTPFPPRESPSSCLLGSRFTLWPFFPLRRAGAWCGPRSRIHVRRF